MNQAPSKTMNCQLQPDKFIDRKLSTFEDVLQGSFLQGNAGMHGNYGIAAIGTAKDEMRTGFTNNDHPGFLKLFKSFASSNNGQFGHLTKSGCLRKLNRNVQNIILPYGLDRKRVTILDHYFNHAFNGILNVSDNVGISFTLSSTTRKQRRIGIITTLFVPAAKRKSVNSNKP